MNNETDREKLDRIMRKRVHISRGIKKLEQMYKQLTLKALALNRKIKNIKPHESRV